jgi:hypothetical protein
MQKLAATLFVSFKTSLAIPAGHPLRRDFLIQSTLDGRVRRIDYHPAADGRVTGTDAIVIDRDDGRFAIDFINARPEGDPPGEGLLRFAFDENCSGILTVKAADIRREPRLTSAREVWRFATMTVDGADRAEVLGALDAEGPIPVRALEGLISTRRDMLAVVYALACEGSVSLDLHTGLDGRTIVRAGIACASSGLRLHCDPTLRSRGVGRIRTVDISSHDKSAEVSNVARRA